MRTSRSDQKLRRLKVDQATERVAFVDPRGVEMELCDWPSLDDIQKTQNTAKPWIVA